MQPQNHMIQSQTTQQVMLINQPKLTIAAFFFLLFAVSLPLQAKAQQVISIITFGDSLSAGYQLPQGHGFSDQLQASLDKMGLKSQVTNAAVSGDTTASGLSRLDWSIPDGTDLVILELGANDALQGLPLDQTKANLIAMIERLKERNITILLAGMQAPPNMGKPYVETFNAIYPALAKDYELAFYPFFLEGVAAIPELNLKDGIHPNKEGITIITSKIAPLVAQIIKDMQS
ncbi:MAG: arylesterase [Cohaesibacter sp.]|nr:arylesterase [Cohaesibacter sp.]